MKLNSQTYAIIAFILLIVLSGFANWYDDKSREEAELKANEYMVEMMTSRGIK